MKLHRDDLVEATLAWVTGKVYESIFGTNLYRSTFVTDGILDERKVQEFIHRTHTVVWRYLNGQQTLDGRCSDFECNLGLEAKKIFDYHVEKPVRVIGDAEDLDDHDRSILQNPRTAREALNAYYAAKAQ